MISGIVNKIKAGAEKLDHNVSQRPWSSSGYLPGSWFIPKAVYGALKYLIYHPTRLTIKGFPYVVNLEQTWKQNIRPKIPFGNPDVYFDVKENKTTSKDYGIRFDPIMKKKGHDEDIRVKVPKYKLPQKSMQQFEAWLESSEEDKESKNFTPKSSDNKKLSAGEQEAYNKLIELYKFLKENNGTVKVEGGTLVIRIDIANKTLEEIKEQVEHCYNALGMPRDTKMIKTIADRLYEKTQDREISNDEPFAKQQLKSASTSPSHSISQDKEENIDGEIIEEATAQDVGQQIPGNPLSTSQSQDKNDTKNMEPIKQMPDIRKEEQMSSSMSQFSLTNPEAFPTNIVSLQSKKGPNELQSDLVSRSEIGRSDMNSIKNKIIEVAGEDLGDMSLSTTSIKSSCIPGSRRGEELSRGRSQG
ncbi:hypothetical protein [Candidatus Mesenet endosymbiont of Phosphuga atrata]|uniref:hypothetical protein n=1 Tax=Candidatus Mesenet endosymbiont of Phosphuga atrata TaxID=3066221 RepID=UPI0030D3F422